MKWHVWEAGDGQTEVYMYHTLSVGCRISGLGGV